MKAMPLSLLAVALAATAQVHGATVTIDNTTECTLSQYLTSTGKSIATGDDVVFAGSAAVTVTTELSGLTGTITIRNGATLIAANSAALGTADGETWVESGGQLTLTSTTKAGTVLWDETLHLAGTIRSEEPKASRPDWSHSIYPHKWILEGDAVVSSLNEQNDLIGIEFDQQGRYQLTIQTIWQYTQMSGCTFTNPYCLLLKGYGGVVMGGYTKLNGDSTCLLKIDEGAGLWGFYWGDTSEGESPWTLDVYASTSWAKNWPNMRHYSNNTFAWRGPINLNASLKVGGGNSGGCLRLEKQIVGEGGLGVPGSEETACLHLKTRASDGLQNTFKGGINLGANSLLKIGDETAIPAGTDCKPVSLGDGSSICFDKFGVAGPSPLPDLVFNGKGTIYPLYDKTSRTYQGSWRSAIKKGEGVLDWNVAIGADKLIISNGTVRVCQNSGVTMSNGMTSLSVVPPTFSEIAFAGGSFDANGATLSYGTFSGSGSVLNPDANATLSGGIRVTAAELLSDGWSGIAFDGPLSLGGEAKVTIDDPEALDRNGVYRILTTTAALNVQSLPVEGDASGRWQTRLTADGKGLELYRVRRGLLLVVQ